MRAIAMGLIALVAEPAAGGQIEQLARTFGVDWPHLTAQIVSFAIVCAVLYWFAYQPILRMLEERRRQIAQGLENTEKINAKLASIEAERDGILAEARVKANDIIAEARDVGRRLREQENQRAAASAAQILLKAREAAEQEHALMLHDLKREVGRLVVQTTAAVSGRVLDPADHERLATETAKELAGV
jgi:F-type H+-transporting ATPase subunit b